MIGIVLRTIPYKDTSKLIYVYTAAGVKSFIARNVLSMKSPLRLLADPYKKVDLKVKDKPLATVEDVRLLDHYPNTKRHYEKTLYVHFIGELILKNYTDDDDHPKGFSLLSKVLDQIDRHDDPFLYVLMFSLKSLYLLGFGLQLNQCHQCNLAAHYYDPFTCEALCETHGSNALNETIYALIKTVLLEDASLYHAPSMDRSLKITLFNMIQRLFDNHLSFNAQSKPSILSYFKEQS